MRPISLRKKDAHRKRQRNHPIVSFPKVNRLIISRSLHCGILARKLRQRRGSACACRRMPLEALAGFRSRCEVEQLQPGDRRRGDGAIEASAPRKRGDVIAYTKVCEKCGRAPPARRVRSLESRRAPGRAYERKSIGHRSCTRRARSRRGQDVISALG